MVCGCSHVEVWLFLSLSVGLLVRMWGRLYWEVVVGDWGRDVLGWYSLGLVGVEDWFAA